MRITGIILCNLIPTGMEVFALSKMARGRVGRVWDS